MPEISRFHGMIVAMFHNDHPPPHFHVVAGEHNASFLIDSLQLVEGKLPRGKSKLIKQWAEQHQAELEVNWELARQDRPLNSIEPLS